MKKFKLIIIACFTCSAAIMIPSCADRTVFPDSGEEIRAAIMPVVTRTDGSVDLEFTLYIFDRPMVSGQDYAFSRSITFGSEGATITFTGTDLSGREYRFLFIARENGSEEMIVIDKSAADKALSSSAWSDIRLEAVTPFLSLDNYCGVTDMTGSEIKDAGTIEGTLKRFVGQPVYDIYRVAENDINSPERIHSSEVLSVIDRIYGIDFRFSGLTYRMAFSETNDLTPDREETISMSYALAVETNDDAKTPVPQQDGIIAEYLTNVTGSTRIYGRCLLPADGDGISVEMDFQYIDTIRVCWDEEQSDPGHVHDKWCNHLSYINLNIPRPGLKFVVEPNKFTRHKIGIPCDRVIDVPQEGGFIINTTWDGY